jgi:hypothetical protein
VLSPAVLALFAAIHVYVEATLLVSGILTVPPLQIVAVLALVIKGLGFTVITTVIGVPAQPPELGVTVYVAVPGEVPVAVNVCDIVDPLPAEAPETPLCATVQEYVVPVIVLLRAIEGAVPEQIVCEEGVAVATGVVQGHVIETVTGLHVAPP